MCSGVEISMNWSRDLCDLEWRFMLCGVEIQVVQSIDLLVWSRDLLCGVEICVIWSGELSVLQKHKV